MSYTLYTGQMLDALIVSNDPKAEQFRLAYFRLHCKIAERLAEVAGTSFNPGVPSDFEDERFAAVFLPAHEGQALPVVIAGYDNDDEWGE